MSGDCGSEGQMGDWERSEEDVWDFWGDGETMVGFWRRLEVGAGTSTSASTDRDETMGC